MKTLQNQITELEVEVSREDELKKNYEELKIDYVKLAKNQVVQKEPDKEKEKEDDITNKSFEDVWNEAKKEGHLNA